MVRRALLASLITLAGCGASSEGTDTVAGVAQTSVLDGSPEAVGVLSVLNADSTTVTVLDDDVPLNKRAAEQLVAWRDGADGQRYTYDDRAFQTMQQVDDVPWVGPAAIEALVAYAEQTGAVPQGGELLGTWDSTAFTVDEAEATLLLVNEADYVVLDDDAALSSRAVDNIMAARPLATIAQLAAVPQVGPSAMGKLRNFAQTWAPLAEDGEALLGENCESEDACADGLVCLGAISWGSGWCVEDSFAATFDMGVAAPIPDGDPAGVTSSIDVQGLASVPIDIRVWIDLDHPDPQSLTYTLIDPNGATATLSAPGEGSMVDILWRNITSDDEIHGDWSLQVVDPVAGDAGTLLGWSLYLTSTWD